MRTVARHGSYRSHLEVRSHPLPSHISVTHLHLTSHDPCLPPHCHIMSSGDPSVPCPPTAPSKSEKAIQHACDILRVLFLPEDDDDKIQQRLSIAWFDVHSAILQDEDSKRERLRNESEFYAYLTAPENNGERKREFFNLLRSMAKEEVLWTELFKNGTLLSSLRRQAH